MKEKDIIVLLIRTHDMGRVFRQFRSYTELGGVDIYMSNKIFRSFIYPDVIMKTKDQLNIVPAE